MDFSDEMAGEVLKIFQVESEEIISKLNNNLMDLEKNPKNKDAILLLFREAHSLKGASRMVGFNNVQAVAHKIEDVLGLAKEDKLLMNSQIIDILYKSVDFLAGLINKALTKGQETYTDEIAKQIELLENIENIDENLPPQANEQLDFNLELFAKNLDSINNFFADALCSLMKLEATNDASSIKNLLVSIEALHNIFKDTGPYEIKKTFEDIKFKLEFITKASNCLRSEEIAEFHKIFEGLIDKLITIFEIHNLPSVDYYDLAFNRLNEKQDRKTASSPRLKAEVFVDETPDIEMQNSVEIFEPQTFEQIENEIQLQGLSIEEYKELNKFSKTNEATQVKEFSKAEILPETESLDEIEHLYCLSSITDIQEKIVALPQNTSSMEEISKFLNQFQNDCAKDEIKGIFQILIKILDFAQANGIIIDEETASVLSESVEYCDNAMKNIGGLADKDLIIQRLEIILQVLELKNKDDEESALTAKPKKSADFSEIFDSGEIKTLRVDSEKLDALVSQVNELTVTKIKTRKHLYELNEVNNELAECQKNATKALTYLKHFDKKVFLTETADSSHASFLKQFLTTFSESAQKVQEIVLNINNIQRTFQEDDTKINVALDNLESMVKNIRVLPLAMVFHLFGRMVRDIAQENNKKIDLEILGSETTTDKKIIEEIKTPLIHIIRNAIDHGIETPEERSALGKNPTGKIILSAQQVNNKVIIEIKDDGRGINIAKIREKALRKGFLTEEELESMNDEQITNLIFAPGFSTGEEITNLSGRGIGLDVVQTKIEQLNGRVRVLSELNRGCCVQIELPTAMSLVKSFLVKSSEQIFAVPMEVIKTVLRKKPEEIICTSHSESIILDGEKIPLYNLANVLNLPNSRDPDATLTILIIESNDEMIALAVDKLIGDQEILHKKLSAPFYKLKNISGITTLDSGEICFILNISDILNNATVAKTHLIQTKSTPKMQNSDYKILLVDDSITTITLEKNILARSGYTLETAENPIMAFEKIKTTSFDLIISDVEMPEMDGFSFLEKLKTDEMYSDIPVIMMSSLSYDENYSKAVKMGAKTFLNKNNFKQDEFLEAVKAALLSSN